MKWTRAALSGSPWVHQVGTVVLGLLILRCTSTLADDLYATPSKDSGVETPIDVADDDGQATEVGDTIQPAHRDGGRADEPTPSTDAGPCTSASSTSKSDACGDAGATGDDLTDISDELDGGAGKPPDSEPAPDAAVIGDPPHTTADAGSDAAVDLCPNNPDKTMAGACGCDMPETDSDGDLLPDCVDLCQDDPTKSTPGLCGCDVPEETNDTDSDGTIDCLDACREDPDKTTPGLCGCDVLEETNDTDSDGTIDCLDACREDPNKTAPGLCGCDVPEETNDGDGDGTIDCQDGCPNNPENTTGACACLMPDTVSATGEPLCEVLSAAMAHRYPFPDTLSSVANDTIGSADGIIVGTQANGGLLGLAGGTSEQYMDLPSTVLDGAVDFTFEAWLTWNGGGPWQRIFDFGTSDAGAGQQGTGVAQLFLTPQTGTAGVGLEAAFELPTAPNVYAFSAAPLATGVVSHVGLVFNDTGNELVLFLDGQQLDVATMNGSLSDLAPVNFWLGRSQFAADPELGATLREIRIYDVALSAAAIQFSYDMGRDAVFP